MDSQTFNAHINAQIDRCLALLGVKAGEYAKGDTDRLHNFRVAGVLQKESMGQALSGMMAKHTVSVYDMVETGQTYTLDLWNEKITDHINYLLLLRAVVAEEFGEEVVTDA